MQCRSIFVVLAVAVGLLACRGSQSAGQQNPSTATVSPSTANAQGQTASSPVTAIGATSSFSAGPTPLTAAEFRQLTGMLSERNAKFFSDNFLSNETSYLQIAADLTRETSPGGVYLGVGPEQNFTYIALSRPALAFIVDIRRDNLILQLLYKALFDQARDRAHFLALLIGREYGDADALSEHATLEQILTRVAVLPRDEKTFLAVHTALRERIERRYGFELSQADKRSLRQAHQAFFKDGLDIRFKLKEKSFRRYPTYRQLSAQADPQGKQLGFLASEQSFRFVQQMQRSNLIIPVVGDFAGDHALPAIASYLKRKHLVVAAFYVSNVEQYLLQNGVWWKWLRNIGQLPTDDRSVFIRCYLDQGRSHPSQMKGHRTTTVLQRMAAFKERQKKKPYRTMWQVSTDSQLSPKP